VNCAEAGRADITITANAASCGRDAQRGFFIDLLLLYSISFCSCSTGSGRPQNAADLTQLTQPEHARPLCKPQPLNFRPPIFRDRSKTSKSQRPAPLRRRKV